MKKSFYQILGLKKNATTQEVKHAYRAKSRDAHPDKGGSTEAMADINAAYACLKDPSRRLTYDQTGADTQQPPIQAAIRDVLMGSFNELIDKNIERDCLGYVRNSIQTALYKLRDQDTVGKSAKKKLIERREKIKVKNGDNLFHVLVDDRLKRIESDLARLEYMITAHQGAIELLKQYESIEEAQQIIGIQFHSNVTFSDLRW